VQEQVAEVAEAFYQRAYELAVLLARAVTGRWWSSPLTFGCGADALPQVVRTRSSGDVYPRGWAAVYNDCT
jgi:hypothetical protein